VAVAGWQYGGGGEKKMSEIGALLSEIGVFIVFFGGGGDWWQWLI
jgi:hypothetical protein